MTATKLAREVSVAASFGSSRIAARIGNIQRICDREVALIHQAFGRRDGYFFRMLEPDDSPVHRDGAALPTLPFARHVGSAARYFSWQRPCAGPLETSAPQNLVCLSIQHGVQRFLHRAKNHLDNSATRMRLQGCLNGKRQQAASFCRRGGFAAEFGAKRRHTSHQSLIRGGKVIAVKPNIVLQTGAAVESVHFILVPPNAGSCPGRLGHQLFQLRDFELEHFSDRRHGVLRVCPGTSSGITKFSEHEAD
jgi:hypothetical protein